MNFHNVNYFDFLKTHIDHIIFVILGLMSFIMLWKTLERAIFYWRMNLKDYADEHQLDIALEKGLTPIYTVGSNAPYVGLLGTVVGILLTFYEIGQQGGQIDIAQIMVGLALALKATALGILVAIPAIVFYNILTRKAQVRRLQWLSLQAQQS